MRFIKLTLKLSLKKVLILFVFNYIFTGCCSWRGCIPRSQIVEQVDLVWFALPFCCLMYSACDSMYDLSAGRKQHCVKERYIWSSWQGQSIWFCLVEKKKLEIYFLMTIGPNGHFPSLVRGKRVKLWVQSNVALWVMHHLSENKKDEVTDDLLLLLLFLMKS